MEGEIIKYRLNKYSTEHICVYTGVHTFRLIPRRNGGLKYVRGENFFRSKPEGCGGSEV